jgi:hypothetical protein
LLTGVPSGLIVAGTNIFVQVSYGWEAILTDGILLLFQIAVATVLANAAAIWIAVRLARRLDEPVDLSRVLSPKELLRADRSTAQLQAVLCGLAAALFASIVYPVFSAPIMIWRLREASFTWKEMVSIFVVETAIPGLEAWATVLFLLVFTSTAWGRFLLARTYFALTGRLPFRLMTFLREAHLRGVLRQSGSVYQFRHLKLRDRLAHTADLGPTVGRTSEGTTGDLAPASPLSG